MKYICILCWFLWAPATAQLQTITIKDSQTGEGLEMVTLLSESPKLFATTNHKGEADISAFKNVLNIQVLGFGYKTVVKSFAEIEQAGFILQLDASAAHFEEIVVTATRWKQSSKNVPAKISVISPKDVTSYNPQTAADMLGSTGEVFIQKSQQGGGSPMIRGFATNRLLYAVDGVRMNSAIFRAGNIQNVIALDPFAIENTEIFFGPGSIIFGSDAIGGVMSFQTLTPQLSASEDLLITGKAVSRYASANSEFTKHFDVNAAGKKFSYVASLTHADYGHLQMGKNGPDSYLKHYTVQRLDSMDRVFENKDPMVQDPTAYSQLNLMQKLRFRPNAEWNFEYAFHLSESSEFSRYDRLIETQSNGLPVSAVWNYGPQIWRMHNLSISQVTSNKFYDGMTLRLAHQYFEESRIDRRLNHHRLRNNLEEVNAFSINLDFEKDIHKHRIHYGLEYVVNDVNSTGTAVDIRNGSAIQVPDRYPASVWKSYAAYANYQYKVSDRLLLQAGARIGAYDIQSDFTRHLVFFPFDFTNSTVKNSAAIGSLGFVYRPAEKWRLHVNLGTGFRAPNVDDIGKIFDFVSGEVIVPNTSLKAEYAYNGEIGITKIFGERIKLELAAYYTYLDHAMVRRAFQVNGQDSILYDGQMSKVYAIQNAAYGRVSGLNAGIEIKLFSGWSLLSKYNYQSGKEEMDNGEVKPSRHAAPAFGMTQLVFHKKKLDLQFYAVYSASVIYEDLNPEEQSKLAIYAKDANGNPYSPSWYTINFKTMYQLHENWTLSAGIENLTDQRYRPYSSGLVAGGRNFILALRAGF
ncbi:MAG: TonB-dependent receptor [Saprospiraceae bacterium]|nr:TonB-dependent receptor [Saprospiraceae bacterium]